MNDKEIKEYIVKNKGLIGRVAMKAYEKYDGTILSYDDFFQEGMVIAMKYLKNYNPKIAKASTYISDCIWRMLARYGGENYFDCKVSHWISDRRSRYYKYRNELNKRGKQVTQKRIARFFKISRSSADLMISALEGSTSSYYELDEETTFYNRAKNCNIEDDANTKININYVKRMMNKLPEREKFVLEKRVYEEKTLQDIGNIIGCSKERTRQIIERAKKRLKHIIEFDTRNKELIL